MPAIPGRRPGDSWRRLPLNLCLRRWRKGRAVTGGSASSADQKVRISSSPTDGDTAVHRVGHQGSPPCSATSARSPSAAPAEIGFVRLPRMIGGVQTGQPASRFPVRFARNKFAVPVYFLPALHQAPICGCPSQSVTWILIEVVISRNGCWYWFWCFWPILCHVDDFVRPAGAGLFSSSVLFFASSHQRCPASSRVSIQVA